MVCGACRAVLRRAEHATERRREAIQHVGVWRGRVLQRVHRRRAVPRRGVLPQLERPAEGQVQPLLLLHAHSELHNGRVAVCPCLCAASASTEPTPHMHPTAKHGCEFTICFANRNKLGKRDSVLQRLPCQLHMPRGHVPILPSYRRDQRISGLVHLFLVFGLHFNERFHCQSKCHLCFCHQFYALQLPPMIVIHQCLWYTFYFLDFLAVERMVYAGNLCVLESGGSSLTVLSLLV